MTRKIIFAPEALGDIKHWERHNPKIRKRIHTLITNILDLPFEGIGKPEALRHEWSGCWSRRIDREHRLVYRVTERGIEIIRCRFHY